MEYFIGITRYALPVLAFVILIKCVLTLLLGHPVNKVYAYIVDAASGEKIPLNMWETSIGKGKSCDIKLTYPGIAASQAVISRRADGWYIYDTRSKNGTGVNGKKITERTIINHGDKIIFADKTFIFTVADDPVITVGSRKKSSGKQLSAKDVQLPENMPQRKPTVNTAQQTGPVQKPYVGNTNTQQTSWQKIQHRDFDNNNFNLNFKNVASSTDEVKKTTLKGDTLHSGQRIFTSAAADTDINNNFSANFGSGSKNEPAIINCTTGQIFVLCGDYIKLGRATSCDIIIDGSDVSRNHAALKKYKDGWAVLDTNSKAGTFLNGNKVTNPLLLFDGDSIKICKTTFRYTVDYKRR